MKLCPVLAITVLAVVVEAQLGLPSCFHHIPEPTKFFLNTKPSPTYRLRPIPHTTLFTNISQIRPKRPVKIIVHGWNQTYDDPLLEELTLTYLNHTELNVIRVDYSELAAQPFAVVLTKLPAVVNAIVRFIQGLKKHLKIDPKNLHVIGHSLGAQVVGSVGKGVIGTSTGKLGRITALDAGRPAYESVLVADSQKLNKGDAILVDVIHTDAGEIGLEDPAGHVDFYPNGGRRLQPNCVKSEALNILNFTESDGWKPVYVDDMYCSHQRSIRYLTKSISHKVEATKCESWEAFKGGKCSSNEKVTFGEHLEKGAEGVFYLEIAV